MPPRAQAVGASPISSSREVAYGHGVGTQSTFTVDTVRFEGEPFFTVVARVTEQGVSRTFIFHQSSNQSVEIQSPGEQI